MPGPPVAAGWPPLSCCRLRLLQPWWASWSRAVARRARAQDRCAGERSCVRLGADRRLIGHSEALGAPLQSTFYDGALWNLSFTGILTKLDPQTGQVVGTAGTAPVPCGLAAGEGALWVSDCSAPAVIRIDPVHDVVVGRAPLPVPRAELADATQSVAVGAGSIWVGQGFDNPSYVWRLDPATGRVLHRYVIPSGGAQALTFGNGAVWVGGGVIGRLSRIDPATNAVRRRRVTSASGSAVSRPAAATSGRRPTRVGRSGS